MQNKHNLLVFKRLNEIYMRKLLPFLMAIVLLIGFSGRTMATDPPTSGIDYVYLTMDEMLSIAVVDATATNANTFEFAKPLGGASIVHLFSDPAATNAPAQYSWLNYTSVIASTNHQIVVSEVGTIPAGTTLNVTAATPTSDGSATTADKGTPTNVNLTTGTGQVLIDDIKSCWTGAGAGKGVKLTYDWSVTDYTTVVKVASQVTITVTYTIQEKPS